MWHAPQFSNRLELLIKPSNFGYNSYNQLIYLTLPSGVVSNLNNEYDVIFVDKSTDNNIFFTGNTFYDNFENGLSDKWSFSGNDGWEITASGNGYNSAFSVKSKTITHNQTACMYITFYSYEAGDVEFYWKISSQLYGDHLYFYVNDSLKFVQSGEQDWSKITWPLSVGSNTLKWCYTKDASINTGDDCGWVDEIKVTGIKDIAYNSVLPVFPKKIDLENNIAEYYVKTTSIDDINYTSLFVYYDFVASISEPTQEFKLSTFGDAYIVNFLNTTDLISTIGSNFSNHGAALQQPICNTHAAKTSTAIAYVSCNISKSSFTLFFNCYLVSGEGYLVYFSSNNHVYVNLDGSLIAKINGTDYSIGSRLYFDVCSTFSITCDGSNTYVIINGLTKLVIKQTFSISGICLGGNGSSGYSVECYFFDLFLLSPKLPLYSYYLHSTTYDSNNFFRESGYDNTITNGYLTSWPEVIFAGDEVMFRNSSCSGVVYSVSFNNGNSWYVSNLNYEDVFTKYFDSPSEFDTVLRLTSSSGTIDKNYIIKVNDFNRFDVNCGINFTTGVTKDGYDDTEIDFIAALPDFSEVEATPVEYTYEVSAANLKLTFLDRPVEYLWGGTLGSGVISKDVEYCFDVIMDSWVDDTEIDFWLGELYQGYYRNYYMYFTLSSGWLFYVDLGVGFVLANWKYFPTKTDIICSVAGYNDQDAEAEVGKGELMRFLSDTKASNMVYDDFNSSMFCSLSGVFPDCFSEIQVISGSIGSYESNIYCSLLDISNNFGAEIKLNTTIIENFNIDETVIVGTVFCFSADVYDMYYGVTTSGIQIYMNTNTITGNEVVNKTFLTISGGHTVSWCYDVGELSPSEYIEIVVRGTNEYGDLNIASYFLRYGKRHYYNLYHITKHNYETLIPMLMVAENNVSVFPSFSTESMYVRIENYKRKSLGASIFGVSLDKGDIQAEVVALTNNFYNGGHYKVRIECNDLSGNVMNPLEFEFTIRSDGL